MTPAAGPVVALVTGGSRGIGRAIAETLASAGARVCITARSAAELQVAAASIEQRGGRVLARAADVTDKGSTESVVAEVERSLGPISLLVNNAGVLEPLGVLWEADPGEWWRCFEINVKGPFLYSRAVLPGMIARGEGRIINLASSAAVVPIPDGSAYCASKAALVRMTDTLAAEVAGFGVRVFAIEPGNVPTRMHEILGSDPSWLKRRGSHTPVYTPAQQTADLVLRLALGQADALSGRFLSVRDDLDELIANAEAIQREDRYALRLRE